MCMCYLFLLLLRLVQGMASKSSEVWNRTLKKKKTENISGDIGNSSCMCCVKQSRDIIVCNCNYYSEIKNSGCVNISQTIETNKN